MQDVNSLDFRLHINISEEISQNVAGRPGSDINVLNTYFHFLFFHSLELLLTLRRQFLEEMFQFLNFFWQTFMCVW